MKKPIWWVVLILGLGVGVAIVYYAMQRLREPPPQPPRPAAQAPAPPAPQTHFPVEQEPQGKPLPALSESDPAVKDALSELWSDKTLQQLFQLKSFIRRVVATIDNLPRKKLPLRLTPVKLAAGKFLVSGKDENFAISRSNAARYAPYVRLAGAVDTGKLVAVYVHFYPLFQEAYLDLGYPKGYFNDRLIEAIDDLLATPEVREPIKLVRPNVFYLFADADLEARSAGQKIFMRIGSENAARIKTKLREIRGELTRKGPKP